jgi:GxxExxY protein
MSYKHSDVTDKIISCFYTVYNNLGYGFLEKVYTYSLALELEQMGVKVAPEAKIEVYYGRVVVGEYFADLVVADAVIVEVKAVRELVRDHEAQLLNYLKATPYEVGLLLNFGPKAEVQRKIFDNDRKGSLKWLKSSEQ